MFLSYRLIVILLGFLTLAATGFGQQVRYTETDSLRKLISSHPRDTASGRLYGQLAQAWAMQGNWAAATKAAQSGWALSQKLSYRPTMAYNQFWLGRILRLQGKYEAAFSHYKVALKHYQALKDNQWAGNAYHEMAQAYHKMGILPKALKAYQLAHTHYEKAKNTPGILSALANCSLIKSISDDNAGALADQLKVLHIRDTCNCDPKGLLYDLYNAGSMLDHLERRKESLQYYKRAYQMAKEQNDAVVLAYSAAVISETLMDKQQYDSAHTYLAEALGVTTRSPVDSLTLAVVNNHYSRYYLNKGQLRQARSSVQMAISVFEQQQDIDALKNSYENLWQIEKAANNPTLALEHYMRFVRYRDSLVNEKQAHELGRVEAQYEAKRELDKQKVLQVAEMERRNWQLGSTVGGLLLMFGLAFTLFRSRQKERNANHQLRSFSSQILDQKLRIEAQNHEISSFNDELNNTLIELNRQRNQLEKSNQKLQELDQMKEELTGMIVHDLKNPLNAILALGSMPPDAQRLNIMRGAGQQMSQLVSNLLDVQKYENAALEIQPKPANALQIINDATDQTDFLAEQKQIQFRFEVDERLIIAADSTLLVRVFVNLLTNAIKYAPAGDTLIIEGQYDAEKAAIFRITDHGKGIPAEMLNSVFEKFSQVGGGMASGNMHSTGLGLTFCRLTIEAHGGSIRALSEEGKYTTIEFNIPQAKLGELSELTAKAKGGSHAKRTEKQVQLPEPYRQSHADTLARLQQSPIYELSHIFDLLDELPETSAEVKEWKNQVEGAALAGNATAFGKLLG